MLNSQVHGKRAEIYLGLRRFTTLITALIVVVLLAVPAPATGDRGENPEFDPANMVFPLEGDEYRIIDSFGDCRGSVCSRSHEGVDIMAPKGTEVYAVGAGTATWVSDSDENCCRLAIDHGNGWFTRYLHLNDDAVDEDGNYEDHTDGEGWGIVEGIVDGTEIEAGQLIGWVGDSGNAGEGTSHLHLELRRSSGGSHWETEPIDAYPYVIGVDDNRTGQFDDDDDSVHEENIDKIFEAGITVGCNPPYNNEFCPGESITRGQMAAFIARALDLTEMSGVTEFDDLAEHQFENAVDKIMTAGIGFGCGEDSYCPDRPLQRDEMAELLARSFGYDNPDGEDFFSDDDDNPFHESVNKLAANGITVGCNPPAYDHFCPGESLTRAQMATFFVRVGAA